MTSVDVKVLLGKWELILRYKDELEQRSSIKICVCVCVSLESVGTTSSHGCAGTTPAAPFMRCFLLGRQAGKVGGLL